jgi:hypothetical protein
MIAPYDTRRRFAVSGAATPTAVVSATLSVAGLETAMSVPS